MAILDGSARPVELAPGYRLQAPGLVGAAEIAPVRQPGVRARASELSTAALDEAFDATDVRELQTITVDAAPAPSAADRQVRTTRGEAGLVLEVPDLGETVGQVVLAIDESGVVTWHYPEDGAGALRTPAVRGAGGVRRFVIRAANVPAAPGDDPTTRSLATIVGRKVLKVLVYPLVDTVLQHSARYFARKWEEQHRPYSLRWFRPENYRDPAGPPLVDADWDVLGRGRALLFLHGTFSRSFSAFHGLSPDAMGELSARYEGRVFAFDHYTMSHDPERNLVELLDRLPVSVQLQLDVVSHSRGGLVARALAGETSSGPIPRVRVERSVFVAAPNHGTALADARHLSELIDRYTTILNLIPPGPHEVVTDVLEAIITAVKMVGSAALDGLPGLGAMAPDGAYLARLNTGVPVGASYYGIAADYEPTGGLKGFVIDGIADRVFGRSANDLVVPTEGVYAGSDDPAFPIPTDRLLQIGRPEAVGHTRYFGHPATASALLEWLA